MGGQLLSLLINVVLVLRLRNIDEGILTGNVFIDLKKAFDTVGNATFLRKFNYCGIKAKSLKWFWVIPMVKKTTTKLLSVHIDESISRDDKISHVITKVRNGLRMLYKLVLSQVNEEHWMLFIDHLCSRISTTATLCGVTAQKRVKTIYKNFKIGHHVLPLKWTIQ